MKQFSSKPMSGTFLFSEPGFDAPIEFVYDLLHYKSDTGPTGPYIVLKDLFTGKATGEYKVFSAYCKILSTVARYFFFPGLFRNELAYLSVYVPKESLYRLAAYLLLQDVNAASIPDDTENLQYDSFDRLVAFDSVRMRFSDIVVAGLLENLDVDGFFQMALFLQELLKHRSLLEITKDIIAFKTTIATYPFPIDFIYDLNDPAYRKFLADFFPKFKFLFGRYVKFSSSNSYESFMTAILRSVFHAKDVVLKEWEHTSWLAAFADLLPILVSNDIELDTVPILTSLAENGIVFEDPQHNSSTTGISSPLAYINSYSSSRGRDLKPWVFYNPFTLTEWWKRVKRHTVKNMQAVDYSEKSDSSATFYIKGSLDSENSDVEYAYFGNNNNAVYDDYSFKNTLFPITMVIPIKRGGVTYVSDASFYFQIYDLFAKPLYFNPLQPASYELSRYGSFSLLSAISTARFLYAPATKLPIRNSRSLEDSRVVVWGMRDVTPGHEHFAIRRVSLLLDTVTMKFIPEVVLIPAARISIKNTSHAKVFDICLFDRATGYSTVFTPIVKKQPGISNYAEIYKEYKEFAYDKRRPAQTILIKQVAFYIESLLRSVEQHTALFEVSSQIYRPALKDIEFLPSNLRERFFTHGNTALQFCTIEQHNWLPFRYDILLWLMQRLKDLTEVDLRFKLRLQPKQVTLSVHYFNFDASSIDVVPFKTFSLPFQHTDLSFNDRLIRISRLVDWFWYLYRFAILKTKPLAHTDQKSLFYAAANNAIDVQFDRIINKRYTFTVFDEVTVFWDRLSNFIAFHYTDGSPTVITKYEDNSTLLSVAHLPNSQQIPPAEFLEQLRFLLDS